MLLDWITARVPLEHLSEEARQVCREFGERIQRFCPKSGNIVWETSAWDSIRSDSHQLSMRVGLDLWVQGSPARVMGDGCAVFGSGASAALDIAGSLKMMIAHASKALGVQLPDVHVWNVSRVDVTGNLFLPSLSAVRDALRILRDCEGGRYRVSQQAGDTVYWSHGSRLRSGKAYAKGPHLRHLMKKKDYTGRRYNDLELMNADQLLRLELKLSREFFARHNWQQLTPTDLEAQWQDYFMRMIGDADMKTDNDILDRVNAVAPTEGQAKSAYGLWTLIKSEGWERAQQMTTKPTWYRNLKILRQAGLGDADIAAGQVVPLRRRVLEAQMINTWAELHHVA